MIRPGQWIGGIRDLETLRLRCVIDQDTDCWHLRKADGRKMSAADIDTGMTISVHGRGNLKARRFAVECAKGSKISPKMRVACCKHAGDCVNPAHCKPMPVKQLSTLHHNRGSYDTATRAAAYVRNGMRNRKLTDELAQWLLESTQSQPEIAHALGIHMRTVQVYQTKARLAKPRPALAASSIFALAARVPVFTSAAMAA